MVIEIEGEDHDTIQDAGDDGFRYDVMYPHVMKYEKGIHGVNMEVIAPCAIERTYTELAAVLQELNDGDALIIRKHTGSCEMSQKDICAICHRYVPPYFDNHECCSKFEDMEKARRLGRCDRFIAEAETPLRKQYGDEE